ncbi:hypothetical protein VUR80DRAFT_9380 [Thermomyces stellatus]
MASAAMSIVAHFCVAFSSRGLVAWMWLLSWSGRFQLGTRRCHRRGVRRASPSLSPLARATSSREWKPGTMSSTAMHTMPNLACPRAPPLRGHSSLASHVPVPPFDNAPHTRNRPLSKTAISTDSNISRRGTHSSPTTHPRSPGTTGRQPLRPSGSRRPK